MIVNRQELGQLTSRNFFLLLSKKRDKIHGKREEMIMQNNRSLRRLVLPLVQALNFIGKLPEMALKPTMNQIVATK